MDVLVQIGQMVLMLSILVVLHEFGHFLPAKWFKTKVEKFFLFFDWPFAILKKKIGETTWGVGILPLGGYVKIAGMIDESMDKEQLKQPPQPWEFRSKPAWQRLIIMLGGVTVNVVLAWVLYAFIFMTYGQKYPSLQKINQDGIAFGEVGKKLGFQNGDKILSVDGKKQDRFNRVILDVLLGNKVEIERNGERKIIIIPDSAKAEIFEKEGKGFISARSKNVIVDSVPPGSNNGVAQLKKNDRLLAVDGKKFRFFDEFSDYLSAHKNQKVQVTILREGIETKLDSIKVTSEGTLGFFRKPDIDSSQIIVKKLSFTEAVPAAVKESFEMLQYNIKQIRLIFKPETKAYTQARSFIGITKLLPTVWDWEFFWSFTAMFSIWLAFINLLPIPGLDGGHALFTIVEMITGRTLSDKAMGVVQTIGMIILLSLMLLLFGKDIYDLIIGR